VTYPVTTALLGIPGVKTIRSYSFFGFSTIYVIFEENVEFYWSRARIIEKLNSLPAGTLPADVQPALGPDATALGQVFWYTLEGRDPDDNPSGGWDLDELRAVQDWQVRYALMAAGGVAEVASVGGFVREYQVDVDPDAMRAYGVTLADVFQSVKMSNVDVGARTIEVNSVEYVVRGLGFLKSVDDLGKTVVAVRDNVPVRISDIARVHMGPALRRGALDKGGAEAVGGVVVVRYGSNPLAGIKNVKAKINEIAPALPVKAVLKDKATPRTEIEAFATEHGFSAYDGPQLNQPAWTAWLQSHDRSEWPRWITTSKVAIVPFYDRTGLIYETLGTLNSALIEEILVTIIVVLVMVRHLRSSMLISAVLPLAVLICFVAMKLFGVDANIVALSGIAIAIGTMVDMGVIVCENILRHLDQEGDDRNVAQIVFAATSEVGSAVVTAVSTTVISFLPVFTMTGAEGKLFRPLAFTKTFALSGSVILALIMIPPLAALMFPQRHIGRYGRLVLRGLIAVAGVAIMATFSWWIGLLILLVGLYHTAVIFLPKGHAKVSSIVMDALVVSLVAWFLADHWMPLGPEKGSLINLFFVAAILGGLLAAFLIFQRYYQRMLRWCLDHKLLYLSIPTTIVLAGLVAWLGFDRVFAFVPGQVLRSSVPWQALSRTFPGLGKEFMPPLDEGSFLLMPTTMPHASIGEALSVLQYQDQAIESIPEVESVVGKIGRADSSLDPAPISMIETVITYKSEYITDHNGHRMTFRYNATTGKFDRNEQGDLIPDPDGRPYRQWRDEIRTPDDIWEAIVRAARVPGTTSAPKLQPIAARIVMLQSGMRAPMGVKVRGPNLDAIEQVGIEIERMLQHVEGVEPGSVFAERIVGKPYLEIAIDRDAIARYGLRIREVQDVIEVAIGGQPVTTTVEGRERYPVRVRYLRELRDQIESLERILVPSPTGAQVPLGQVAAIQYVRGPMAIKSEDTLLVGYVLFDKKPGYAEVDVVEDAKAHLDEQLASGAWTLPAGVSYVFAGNYQNQIRAQKTLALVLPLALFSIFMILYFQFRSVLTTSMVFSGIVVTWAAGFMLIWLYGQPWFLDLSVADTNLRDLFQVHPINLSVAVWVGFLALFGIASDDGVVIATYLDQSFSRHKTSTVQDIRQATVAGAVRRIRPCLITSATTILALIPVLTSTGRGADVMVPMAIPSFGGMVVELTTVFLVPVLYCTVQEMRLTLQKRIGKGE